MADGPDCTCGGAIPSGRRDGFCSSWCRSRDEQGLEPSPPPPRFSSSTPPAPVALVGGEEPPPRAGAVPAGQPGRADDDEPTRPRYRQRRRLIADEVEERLRQAGMVDSWQGAQALDLADALDYTGGSGSARAALHRELRSIMSDLLRGQAEAGSSVGQARDELAARRARRTGGGA